MDVLERHRVFGGELAKVAHVAASVGGSMTLTVFTPPGAGPHPYLIWLSGLTCTSANFTEKAGAYRAAAALGLAVVAPDTSPRGEDVADDPAYDLGQGAGFYLDATEPPWAAHFRMESYVTGDLIDLVEAEFPLARRRRAIAGHSMGGHGALTLALRHPDLFSSMSAFAPIAAPSRCPWGVKAFTAYLGEDRAAWAAHDAVSLLRAGVARRRFDDILVDQGEADPFLAEQLRPETLRETCLEAGQPLTLNLRAGYDHSYYFIATFIGDHLRFHAERLR